MDCNHTCVRTCLITHSNDTIAINCKKIRKNVALTRTVLLINSLYCDLVGLSYIRRHQADLTVSKKPGTSYRIKIHFAVFNHLYLLFSFMELVETL